MSYRETEFAPEEFYHIYNRGNSRQEIFLDTADYKRFQDLLYLANAVEPISVRNARRNGVYEVERGEQLVAIGAYCLMPNHFHILLTPLTDNAVTTFMLKVATGYAMYFNKRYTRTGSLFEGKFKSKHVIGDEYMKYLFSYIHLNPLKLKHTDWKTRILKEKDLLRQGREYQFSSYQDYVQDLRSESMILGKDHFPKFFLNPVSWEGEMREWITFPEVNT
ncbi:MAG: transposase [Candidatus Pacebacteria bacterium]|nr:transposase [Candidatus Paceibacterota bacterium]MCF7857495.1 transposase [Candidatus Paceibacterota bacterium]